MIDFNALRKNSAGGKVIQSPREIYLALPNKSSKLSSYPRDVQGEVWQQWFDRRTERDLVLKMNTGGGKTIVGLLILQSSLQEGVGPAVYLTPNKMLAGQALDEAKALGVAATNNVDDAQFRAGKAILITHLHKVVNGLTVFGVRGGRRQILNLGTIVFDDAHISLETIEEQFSLSLPKGVDDIYDKIFELFYTAVSAQSPSIAMEIRDGAPHRQLLVPYWSWQKNLQRVMEILAPHREKEVLVYNWSLVQEYLKHSHCVISADCVEITPHCVPMAMIPSIADARRRIFMTATLADDSVLSSHFGVNPDTIERPIVPKGAGDVGDRMILAPQLVDPSITDDDCIDLARQLANEEHINVVVIVPSEQRSKRWADKANEIWVKTQVDSGVARLRAGEIIGLVVLVNRYDGIDLAGSACRVLFLDGLPDVRRDIDVIKQAYLLGSTKVAAQLAQRIEQGAGRGVRSLDDYCGVILMGKTLCSHVYNMGVLERFSPATRAQLELSEQVSKMATTLESVKEVIQKQFLARDPDWVTLSRECLSNLTYTAPVPDGLVMAVRKAFDSSEINDYQSAVDVLRHCADGLDGQLGGLARQYLADYFNVFDPAEAQKVQKMAVSMNRQLLKPIDGITFVRAESAAASQAKACVGVAGQYVDGNRYIIAIQSVIDELQVGEDYVPRFEQAMSEMARFLGLKGNRPEQEQGEGPDVLWSLKNQQYIVIECKSGATVPHIAKGYCNQLTGSKVWFDKNYEECQASLLMVHPSFVIEKAASLHPGTRIMTFEKLEAFKASLGAFGRGVSMQFKSITSEHVRELLVAHNLHASRLFDHFSVAFKEQK